MQLKKKLAVLCAGSLLSLGAVTAVAPRASASVTGTITGEVNCTYNQYTHVTGIWVDATNGSDGWATTSSDGVGGKYFSYHLTANSSSFSLHIGCGDANNNWKHTFYVHGLTTQDTVLTCTGPDGCVRS